MWKQVREVTALNLRSVPQRLGSSAVTALGIAGVVVVFVGVLSMAQGFQRTMMTGGDPLTAIVLRSGADSETGSLLGLDTVRLVKEAPGIARENGRSQASAEFAVVVQHAQPGTGQAMNIRLRGVEPAAFNIRDEIRVVDGRSFQPGRYELIVGQAAARELGNLTIGQSVHWGGSTWNIVGVFQGKGGNVESEVWCDVEMLQQAFRRQNAFQAMYATLESPQSLDVLRSALASDPRFEVDVRRESITRRSFPYPDEADHDSRRVRCTPHGCRGDLQRRQHDVHVGGLAYTRDATVRAIGFGRTAVVCSVLVEASAWRPQEARSVRSRHGCSSMGMRSPR